MVDPTEEMQSNYDLLLKVEEDILEKLQHGVRLSEVYDVAVDVVKREKKELLDKLTKSVG